MKNLICVFKVPDNFEHLSIDGPAILHGTIEETLVTVTANPNELPSNVDFTINDNDFTWMKEGWNAYRREILRLAK